MMKITDVINALGSATMQGPLEQPDEPEGTRYIQLSETMVIQMIEGLVKASGEQLLKHANTGEVAVLAELAHIKQNHETLIQALRDELSLMNGKLDSIAENTRR